MEWSRKAILVAQCTCKAIENFARAPRDEKSRNNLGSGWTWSRDLRQKLYPGAKYLGNPRNFCKQVALYIYIIRIWTISILYMGIQKHNIMKSIPTFHGHNFGSFWARDSSKKASCSSWLALSNVVKSEGNTRRAVHVQGDWKLCTCTARRKNPK